MQHEPKILHVHTKIVREDDTVKINKMENM